MLENWKCFCGLGTSLKNISLNTFLLCVFTCLLSFCHILLLVTKRYKIIANERIINFLSCLFITNKSIDIFYCFIDKSCILEPIISTTAPAPPCPIISSLLDTRIYLIHITTMYRVLSKPFITNIINTNRSKVSAINITN